MSQDRDRILPYLEGIRDERRTAANTAERVGDALIMLLDYIGSVDSGGKFLSRVDDDTAQGVITFLKGLVIGDGSHGIGRDGAAELLSLVFETVLKGKDARSGFTDGKGIFMDAVQGIIETDGLEVRGWMRIMTMIINHLQLMESDYSFTEGAEIEHVDYTEGSQLLLRMHKRHENDLIPFYTGDILYAKVNDLLPAGSVPEGHTVTNHGSYYTAWIKVDSVNQGSSTMTVSLYQSQENGGNPIVPGGRNFTLYGTPIMGTDHPSVAVAYEKSIRTDEGLLGDTGFDCSINVTRHGNVADSADEQVREMQKARQQSWVLSTTDQRLSYFWRVDQPIIRDDNYALVLGILPDLANLPSTRDPEMPSLYINTIFYENIHHIYYPAHIVKEDRGEWTSNPTVTYTGPDGTYTPDGTLSASEQAMVGTGGTFTGGQTISEPYHYNGVPRNTWLTSRLASAWADLTDKQLLDKISIEWHLDRETSRVWRFGTLWECRTEGATDEPWMTSTQWVLLSTGTLSMKLSVSRRFLRKSDFADGQVGTTLGFVLMLGDTDISSRFTRDYVNWERITKGAESDPALAAADTAWNENTGRHKLEIPVTSADLPSNFWTVREVQFKCTVDTDGETTRSATITLH